LKAKDGMEIEWTPKKQGGRKITALEFVFQKQPRPAPPATDALKPKKTRKPGGKTIYGVTIADIEKQARPGESYETAAARIAKNRELGLSG
jgi:hypothetical protein